MILFKSRPNLDKSFTKSLSIIVVYILYNLYSKYFSFFSIAFITGSVCLFFFLSAVLEATLLIIFSFLLLFFLKFLFFSLNFNSYIYNITNIKIFFECISIKIIISYSILFPPYLIVPS